ncbi:hypothetical protein BCE02nite_44070 [Brevibacillus centrosporus]|nr:hypothetical protein BCE02nite_44070 [Brevibacillus centrosporus]
MRQFDMKMILKSPICFPDRLGDTIVVSDVSLKWIKEFPMHILVFNDNLINRQLDVGHVLTPPKILMNFWLN